MLETFFSTSATIIPFPARGSTEQLDIFLGPSSTAASSGIIGLAIRLVHRPCRSCGAVHFIITAPVAMHHAGLRCAACDRHNGWLSRGAVTFIQMTVAKFGRPTEAITVHNSHREEF